MCFSSTSSLIAGGMLTGAGASTLIRNKEKKSIPLAAIPLLFGIQQASEGIVWLSQSNPGLNSISTYIFLSFALVLWPFYAPLSFMLIEENPLRKKLMKILFLTGSIVSIYFLLALTKNPVDSGIINNSIQYSTDAQYGTLATIFYIIATCGSPLLSTHKKLFFFGIALTLSMTISAYSYFANFTSIWCFFGAIISLIIFWHFQPEKTCSRLFSAFRLRLASMFSIR